MLVALLKSKSQVLDAADDPPHFSGVFLAAFGVLADLVAANRRLLEDLKVRLWEVEDRLGKR